MGKIWAICQIGRWPAFLDPNSQPFLTIFIGWFRNPFSFLFISFAAGAMRLPCLPDARPKTHFLTDFYVSEERFNLPLAHFANYSEKAYLKFYNENAVRIASELYGEG